MKKLMLIRPVNLLIIGLTMTVILWKYMNEADGDYLIHCALLVVPVVLTAAAGYVVNDLYDTETDKVNKPEKLLVGTAIPRGQAWVIYAVLNIVSLIVSFLSSQEYAMVNTCIISLLYLYSVGLKRTPLLGNVLVAFCSAAVIASTVLVTTFDTQSAILNFGGYIVFAFFITLIRELVKDIQDIEGDKAAGFRTYPVIAGVRGAKVIVYAFSGIQVILCGLYSLMAWYASEDMKTSAVIMGVITLSLFYFINQLAKAKTPGDFGRCSLVLKCLMFAGVVNLIFS